MRPRSDRQLAVQFIEFDELRWWAVLATALWTRQVQRVVAPATDGKRIMSQAAEDLLLVPVPALVVVLTQLERDKGAPLTEAEVLDTRDKAACIAMPRYAYEAICEKRGYRDIEPEYAWAAWRLYTAERDEGHPA